jgi:hypothetical protein
MSKFFKKFNTRLLNLWKILDRQILKCNNCCITYFEVGTQSFKQQHTWPLILQVHHLLQAPLSPSCQHPPLTCRGHHQKKPKKLNYPLHKLLKY